MRISDWSSDVCSSDLRPVLAVLVAHVGQIKAAGGMDDLGEGRAAGGFSGLSETGNRTIDQPRVQRLQVAVAQAETLHDAGAEILDQDIGGLDQIPHQIHGSRILKVERNAFLAGFQMAELAADRKSVGSGKSVSVRVDLGGRRSLTKKTNQ